MTSHFTGTTREGEQLPLRPPPPLATPLHVSEDTLRTGQILRSGPNFTNMHSLGATTLRKIWTRLAQWGQNGKLGRVQAAGVFVRQTITIRHFVNFPTTDFHQIRPRHVSVSPRNVSEKFFVNFPFRGILPKTPQN